MTEAAVSYADKDDHIRNAVRQFIDDLAAPACLARGERDHAVEHVEPEPQIAKSNSDNQQCRHGLPLPETERPSGRGNKRRIGDQVRMNAMADTETNRGFSSLAKDVGD